MHLLVARIGVNNAVVISQKNLIRLMGASRPTVQRAVKKLRDDLWIEVRQIGDRGTTNAYVVNDRVSLGLGGATASATACSARPS